MSIALPKMCSMGSSQTGLVGTIGVALLNPDGTVHTARATADIYEIGGGCYGKNISLPDNWKGSLKWDTGGGTPVYACEEYIADGLIWDEVLTGASHNIPTSAGRRLRQSADVLISREETCQVGGANNEVILDAGASAVDDFYKNDIIVLVSGTGLGQSRHIDSYHGGSKTATVNRDWTTNPDATTDFVVRFDSTKHVHGLESEARQQVRDAMKLAPSAGAPVNGSIDKHLDDIEADTTAIPTVDQIATAIFTKAVEGAITLEQIQRILLSFVGGKTSGGGTKDVRFRDNSDLKARIHMEVDNNGNRTSTTLDGT